MPQPSSFRRCGPGPTGGGIPPLAPAKIVYVPTTADNPWGEKREVDVDDIENGPVSVLTCGTRFNVELAEAQIKSTYDGDPLMPGPVQGLETLDNPLHGWRGDGVWGVLEHEGTAGWTVTDAVETRTSEDQVLVFQVHEESARLVWRQVTIQSNKPVEEEQGVSRAFLLVKETKGTAAGAVEPEIQVLRSITLTIEKGRKTASKADATGVAGQFIGGMAGRKWVKLEPGAPSPNTQTTLRLLPMEVNCPELYMFSGHTGDTVELCKASGTCEWKLKSASPAIGTFDHPTDLACSFTATTKGKNTIQLVMGGNVVWEKPTEVIEIVTRAGWGAVAPKAHTQTMPDFQHVTLHHTSNANTGAAEMQRIQKLHMGLFPCNLPFSGGKNYDDIGYHFIMDKAGVVYEGRQLEVAPGAPGGPYTKGEHVATNNTVAGIGFCTMGDYEATEGNEAWPAARQKDLEKAVSALCRRYKLPSSKLSYHKVMALAASPSLCPGSNYIPSIPDIIKHVNENLQ